MVDSYYSIGDKHLVCQDYALHGSLHDMEYVIVSDGCSGAEHSEIGAQILCHAARYQIELSYMSGLLEECTMGTLCTFLGNSILKRIDEIRKVYPINRSALEATLLIAIKYGTKAYVFGWGDGVIIENFKGDMGNYQRIIEIDHQNKPFYLIHSQEEHFNKWGIEEFTIKFHGDDPPTAKTQHPFYKPFKLVYPVLEDLSIVSLTVCTDGICSFKDADKKPMPLTVMAPKFVNFKTEVDGFVQKRLFFMNKKAQKDGWTHFDDIGSGTILL